MILAVDPGRDTGWALIIEGQLKACGLGAPTFGPFDKTLIERPQVYRGRGSKGNPNDLITLAIQVGQYKERAERAGSPVELVIPHDWKGSLDPDVCCHRVVASLNDQERALLFSVLEPLARKPLSDPEGLTAGRRHNVIDAVGLAKWSIGPRLAGRFSRVA